MDTPNSTHESLSGGSDVLATLVMFDPDSKEASYTFVEANDPLYQVDYSPNIGNLDRRIHIIRLNDYGWDMAEEEYGMDLNHGCSTRLR